MRFEERNPRIDTNEHGAKQSRLGRRFDLVSTIAVDCVARILTEGAAKHPDLEAGQGIPDADASVVGGGASATSANRAGVVRVYVGQHQPWRFAFVW